MGSMRVNSTTNLASLWWVLYEPDCLILKWTQTKMKSKVTKHRGSICGINEESSKELQLGFYIGARGILRNPQNNLP